MAPVGPARPPAHPFQAFVDVLQAAQQAQGISDAGHARKMGVSPGFWSLVQSGMRQPGTKLIMGALRAYPHVHPDPCVACQLASALEHAHAPVPAAGSPRLVSARADPERLEVSA